MRALILTLFLAFSASVVFAGCQSPVPVSHGPAKPFLPPNAIPANLPGFSPEDITRASKLYNAKCARCHKFYDPAAYKDDEWRVWMTKMSKKSHLKADQQELLSRYLEGFRSPRAGGKESKDSRP
jgi:hypothetical protein